MISIGTICSEAGTVICEMYKSIAPKRASTLRHHMHTEFELSLILQGEGVYNTARGNVDICPGDIFLFSTNEPHCITDIYTPDMHILNLHFQPFFIWNTENSYLSNEYLKVFFDRNASFSNRLDRTNPILAELRVLFSSIKSEFDEKLADYTTAIKSKILQILITIYRHFPITNESNTTFTIHKLDGIVRAIEYIDKNFIYDISLDDIAQKAFLSKSHFCVIFKKTNGLTPWEYINIKRINKAVDLLKTTSLSVFDIATQCGYNNTANFNKQFRAITGQTPTTIRARAPSN